MQHKLFFYLILFSWFFIPFSYADWLGTWMNSNMTSTYAPPQSFETRKAGYMTGGSFSTRYVMTNDPVISISKPRFESGCGGIDLFLGGFSFMQPEYLIEKMKRAMGSAAPAFAFDLALGMLSEGMRTSLSNVMDMIDALNALQFDDCSMHNTTKAVLTTAASGDFTRESFSRNTKEFMQESGISNLYEKSVKTFKSSDTDVNATLQTQGTSGMSALVDGCPSDLKNVFFKNGSLIKNAADYLGSVPPYFIPYIRGLFGDVAIRDAQYTLQNPLAENKNATIKDFIRGEFYIVNESGGPKKADPFTYAGITYNNLLDFSTRSLVGIGKKIKSDDDFTEAEKIVVMLMPLDIYRFMAAEISNSGNNYVSVINNLAYGLSEYVAAHIAFQIFSDLFTSLQLIVDLPDKIEEANSASKTKNCKTDLTAPAVQHAALISDNIGVKMGAFFSEKQEILNQYIAVLTANIKIEERRRSKMGENIVPVQN
ncbi:MAG: conjugal transfer protein TraH [Desulforegulaceae bacterium]|nr:conjugal transfer protein TraH [Desulforegulaceae bacterium]